MILTLAGLAVALVEERVPLLEAIERAPAWAVASRQAYFYLLWNCLLWTRTFLFVYFQF